MITFVAFALALLASFVQSPQTASKVQTKAAGPQVVTEQEVFAKLSTSTISGQRSIPSDDAPAVWKASLQVRVAGAATKSKQLELAVAAWAVKDSKSPGIKATEVQMMSIYNEMRQLIVNSTPSGASVTVDNNKWDNPTQAAGFAQIGQRRLIVERNKDVVSFLCDVTRSDSTTATVDFTNRVGSCK